MNYADIKRADISNGTGVRVSLFVSGCNHRCEYCFNKETWDFNYGKKFTDVEKNKIFNELNKPYITGLSLLGGEPMEHINQMGLLPLVKEVKEKYPNKDIWCYTGFTFDTDIIQKMSKNWKETSELLSYIDVMVDGKFVEELKDIRLKFRGSSNQRIIDVQQSLLKNEVVLYEL